MTICFITPKLEIGGYGRFLLNLMGIMKNDTVYTIALNAIGNLKDKFEEKSKVIDLKSKRVRNCGIRLLENLKRINPDVVYVSFSEYIVLVVMIKKIFRLKYKIIIGQHNFIKVDKKINKKILRYCYKSADKIVAVSKFTRDNLCSEIGLNSSYVQVIYNPVIESDKCNDIKALVNNEKINITLLARIEKDKGFQYFIDAFNMVENKEDKRVIVAGEGSYLKVLKQKVSELKLEKYFVFLGFIKQPERILVNTDLLVSLSDHETFGNTIVEALYFNCNILTYKGIGGPEEILEDGLYGCILEKRDNRLICNYINKMKRKNVYNNMLRQRALQFSTDKILGEYKKLFDSLYA